MLKNSEINGTEEIGLVTPTPDISYTFVGAVLYAVHDDVRTSKHITGPFVLGIHCCQRFPHIKDKQYRALMLPWLSAWLNIWTNSRVAGEMTHLNAQAL